MNLSILINFSEIINLGIEVEVLCHEGRELNYQESFS